MANLSKERRERMISKLEELKQLHNDDASIAALNEIENALREKKYGLVWEEHSEAVDDMLKENIPVLIEDPERRLCKDESLPWNFIIEGDNLQSLYLLEKTHRGKVDCIYIDPPYNTGSTSWKYNNDYVDRFDVYKHSKFASFLKARLALAKRLLSRQGIIAVAIDDYEIHNVRLIMDELFGEQNRLGTCVVIHNPGGRQDDKFFATAHEYMLVYALDSTNATVGFLPITEEKKAQFSESDEYGAYKLRSLIRTGAHSRPDERPGLYYPIYINPDTLDISVQKSQEYSFELLPTDSSNNPRVWRWGPDTLMKKKEKYICCKKHSKNTYALYVKEREDDNMGYKPKTLWDNSSYSSAGAITQIKSIFNETGTTVFDYPKSVWLMKDVLRVLTNKNSVIVDFFAGSGTTGHATMELNSEDGGNRRFIVCTNNENGICENVTYPRIKTVLTGVRKDGSKYSDGFRANVKYMKCDWTPRKPDDYLLSNALCLHVKELIELQTAKEVDGVKTVLILSKSDYKRIFDNPDSEAAVESVWVNENLVFSAAEMRKLKAKHFKYIPREYFSQELKEVGEYV